MNKKVEDMITASRLNELLHKKEARQGRTLLWVLATLGAVAAIAAIAYAVYYYFMSDCFDEFEEEFDGDFEDELFSTESEE